MQITPKNVIEIQNTNYISNFIKIQNTNYSKCILNTYFNYLYFNYFTTLGLHNASPRRVAFSNIIKKYVQ